MRLLVAVDGSAASLHALDVVGRWARGGVPFEVMLVNVRDTGTDRLDDVPGEHREAVCAAERRAQDHALREAETRALGCGLAVGGRLAVEGAAAAEIVRTATAQQVDAIVIGAHGVHALGGGSLVPGAVAQRVMLLANRPVLLVP